MLKIFLVHCLTRNIINSICIDLTNSTEYQNANSLLREMVVNISNCVFLRMNTYFESGSVICCRNEHESLLFFCCTFCNCSSMLDGGAILISSSLGTLDFRLICSYMCYSSEECEGMFAYTSVSRKTQTNLEYITVSNPIPCFGKTYQNGCFAMKFGSVYSIGLNCSNIMDASGSCGRFSQLEQLVIIQSTFAKNTDLLRYSLGISMLSNCSVFQTNFVFNNPSSSLIHPSMVNIFSINECNFINNSKNILFKIGSFTVFSGCFIIGILDGNISLISPQSSPNKLSLFHHLTYFCEEENQYIPKWTSVPPQNNVFKYYWVVLILMTLLTLFFGYTSLLNKKIAGDFLTRQQLENTLLGDYG